MDDVRMTCGWHDFGWDFGWDFTGGWHMSSGCHPHIIQKHACHPHITHTSSTHRPLKRVCRPHGATALHKAYWLPCYILDRSWTAPPGWTGPEPVLYQSFDDSSLTLMEGTQQRGTAPLVSGQVRLKWLMLERERAIIHKIQRNILQRN